MYVNSIYKNNMIISWLLTLLFILFHVSFFLKKYFRWWNDEQRRKADQRSNNIMKDDQRSNNIMKDHINKKNK
jgi:uncharacterized membrane protein